MLLREQTALKILPEQCKFCIAVSGKYVGKYKFYVAILGNDSS